MTRRVVAPPDPSDHDTILAPASAAGPSPRAVIRLSGPGTHALLRSVSVTTDSARSHADPTTDSRVHSIRLDLGAGRTLPAWVVRWFAPRSYTGEDGAELLIPGSPALVARVIDRVLQEPCVRPAGPGEFTARAYLAGKLTLDHAEGGARVIAAQNDTDLAAAQRLLSGDAGRVYREWTEEVASLLALVEAGIDFADQEDVRPIERPALIKRLHGLMAELDAQPTRSARAQGGSPRVVLAGAPNAGKSTLFNALLGRDRSTPSETPGSTRDVLAEPFTLATAPGSAPIAMELADTAGLAADGGAAGPETTRAAIMDASVVIVCVPADGTGPVDPAAHRTTLGIPDRTPVVVARTKSDLDLHLQDADPGAGVVPVCAIDGWNLDLLRGRIADALADAGEGPGPIPERHRHALAQARGALGEALVLLGDEPESVGWLSFPELIAAHLREGLDALGSIVGEITPDEVLGRVFASFCVGK